MESRVKKSNLWVVVTMDSQMPVTEKIVVLGKEAAELVGKALALSSGGSEWMVYPEGYYPEFDAAGELKGGRV